MKNGGIDPAAASRGALAASVCYVLWGLVPLYWRQLASIDAVELVAHRHIWSLLLLAGVVLAQGRLKELGAAVRTPRAISTNGLSALLLTGNWLLYVWGVNTGNVIETSLGYFLVPLANVATGRFILGEHLRRAQWIAIVLAAAGVALMVVQVGRPPWIALAIAATWGGYSLMRKRSALPSIIGLTAETLLAAPVAAAFLLWKLHTGAGAFGQVGPGLHLLVISSGVVTATPLLLFAYGARRIRLSTLGLLQYIAPTVQLGLGIWVYHEPFTSARVASFSFIWAALALYTVDNLWSQRRRA